MNIRQIYILNKYKTQNNKNYYDKTRALFKNGVINACNPWAQLGFGNNSATDILFFGTYCDMANQKLR